jgi:hypothetical protein
MDSRKCNLYTRAAELIIQARYNHWLVVVSIVIVDVAAGEVVLAMDRWCQLLQTSPVLSSAEEVTLDHHRRLCRLRHNQSPLQLVIFTADLGDFGRVSQPSVPLIDHCVPTVRQ